MKRSKNTVLGVTAPTARPTIAGGFWLASLVTLPVAALVAIGYALVWALRVLV
ncbi:MAG: hypothetical protein AAGF32_10285 [Pseudomonadota bacterium]